MEITNPSDSYDMTSNIVQFVDFLKKHNVAGTIIVTILSERINEISNALYDHIVMPVINMDINKDGVKDLKKLEDIEYKIQGINFKIGKIFLSIIKIIIMILIIYTISTIIKKINL